MDGIKRKKRFSRKDPEMQREERLGEDNSPYLGYWGNFRRVGVYPDAGSLMGVGRPRCVGDLLWVGMSVPAHPQAIGCRMGTEDG